MAGAELPTGIGCDDAATRALDRAIAEQQVLPLVRTAEQRERLIAEHARMPLGEASVPGRPAPEHSPPLARVVDYLRSRALDGRYVLVRDEREAGYRVGRIVAVGEAPVLVGDRAYPTLKEAEHAVFQMRLEELAELAETAR